MAFFEVGVIYRRNCKYFLAISQSALITFRRGSVVTIRPYVRYDVVRSISVDELCLKWGVPLETLDQITAQFLAPSPEGIKPAPRGSRRAKQSEEGVWRDFRSVRIAKPA